MARSGTVGRSLEPSADIRNTLGPRLVRIHRPSGDHATGTRVRSAASWTDQRFRRPAPPTSPRARPRSDVRCRFDGGRRYVSRLVTTRHHAIIRASGSTGKARPPAAGATINRPPEALPWRQTGPGRRQATIRLASGIAFRLRSRWQWSSPRTSPAGARVISRIWTAFRTFREGEPCPVRVQRRKPRRLAPGPELTHPPIGEHHLHEFPPSVPGDERDP